MRKPAAAAPAVNPLDPPDADTRFHRSGVGRVAILGGAIAVLVVGILIGLPSLPGASSPTRPVAAGQLPVFTPIAPQAGATAADSSLSLDVPFQVQFTRPMNESTVSSALTITPTTAVTCKWDALGQVLSLAPNSHWQPTTEYTVAISSAATDRAGLPLSTPIQASFESGSLTGGQLSATKMVGTLAAPSTTFQLTFTRPVKLATVLMRFSISPPVGVSIVGDDPTDQTSQVFTLTPDTTLATDTTYTVAMVDGGTDAVGASLLPVAPLAVKTLQAPAIVKITPQSDAVVYDTNQPISVQFSVAMDRKSAATALSVKANGRHVAGSLAWTEGDTILLFTPKRSFAIGTNVTIGVAASARSTGGLTMTTASSSSFTVSRPRSRRIASKPAKVVKIPWKGGIASTTSPYHSAELYLLDLMNCTRTGYWVTSNGYCSTQTHRTLPAQPALGYRDDISAEVSRPYAKALADLGALTHYLDGTSPHSRLIAGGFPSSSCGENISSPPNPKEGGMIKVALFFQSEYWNRGGHYRNVMNPHYRWAAVGVWVSRGRTRVVVDFYG